MKDMQKLNEKPIQFENENLYFIKTDYVYGGTAIVAMTEDEELYDYVSINLSEYGKIPNEDCIYLNHNLTDEFVEMFKEHFVEATVDYCVGGWVLFECVKLKKGLI